MESSLHLKAGDRLLLYSDGVTDALSPAGERFGLARLQQTLTSVKGENVQAGVQRLSRQLSQWTADNPTDDLSILALAIE